MLTPVFSLGTLAALVCLLSACGAKPARQSEARQSEAKVEPAPVSVGAPSTIRGKVRFQGHTPTMPVIDFSSNPQCEREHRTRVRAESVIVNPNHTLRDTFVWIKAGLPPEHWPPPINPVTLDQAGCLYRPHVLGVMVNQEIEILNSDPVNHDVHIEASINAASNDVEPPRAESLRKRYPREEIWIPVTCGVHPWMASYVSVVAHPFFRVTGADGAFEMAGVPPGTYVIEAIQEKLGRREQRIALAPGETKALDFVYAE